MCSLVFIIKQKVPFRVAAGKCVLFTRGRKEGGREHLSMSPPSLQYSSVAGPVRADTSAGKQEEQVACLSCCCVPQRGFLLKSEDCKMIVLLSI